MAILGGIAKFILKIFLSGLFGKMTSDIENESKNTKEAAKQAVTTEEEASAVEKKIIKVQAAVVIERDKPKPVDDPFDTDKWNSGESKP